MTLTTTSKSVKTLGWSLVIGVVILGTALRFSNLGQQVYWLDETFTSFRTAGFVNDDLKALFIEGQLVKAPKIQKYRTLTPDNSFLDTAWSLSEDVHPPLYFLLLRVWLSVWGDSIANARGLSAFFSIISIPAIYWLCQELFYPHLLKSQIGGMAIALFAASPFHFIFAQEARPYSFWFLTTAFSTAALLYALRRMGCPLKKIEQGRELSSPNDFQETSWKSWALYGLSVVIGLYSHFLFSVVMGSHVFSLLLWKKHKVRSQNLYPFWSALVFGYICFLPWIIICLLNLRKFLGQVGWVVRAKPSFFEFIGSWVRNFSMLFVNTIPSLRLFPNTFPGAFILTLFVHITLLSLLGFATYRLFKSGTHYSYLLAIAMMLPSALLFTAARSSTSRFAMTLWLIAQILVAYRLAELTYSPKSWQRSVGTALSVILCSVGLFSCWNITQSETWWNKGMNYYDNQVADIINQSDNPLVISDRARPGTEISLLSLSYLLAPTVTVQIVPDPYNINESEHRGFSDVFLYRAARQPFNEKLDALYERVPVHEEGTLWQLSRRP